MTNLFAHCCYSILLVGSVFGPAGLGVLPAKAQQQMYSPIALPDSYEVQDILSEQDIPTGEGSFARDYAVRLEPGDQIAIDLISDNFDAMVILLASDGSKVAENDDGPDGSTNTLLFARITEGGQYIIRVRSFGETGSGKFSLKLTRLRPVNK